MFFLIFFLTFTNLSSTLGSGIGSTLFYDRFIRTECWNERDLAKLRARRIFEQIVPSPVTPERINSKYIKDILHYYRQGLDSVASDTDKQTSMVLKEALADTIGAHLRSELLPTTRFAYYAGYVPYIKVRELHDFYDDVRKFLNTQGLGWKKPNKIPEWSNLTVSKILIGDGKYFHPCGSLVMKRDSSSCMHFSSPILDDDREPSAIALPLKAGGLVSLTSPVSENILLKYYTIASRCILNSSPAKCRHADFVNFNNDMWHWMKRNVAPHLTDEKVYPAYGGVFRIAAAVQSYGKGLSRRNLFDTRNGAAKWQPWKTLTDTYVYVNTDWTPHLYVGVVILAGVSICLMQMCYNFILGDEDGCTCKEHSKHEPSSDIEYAQVNSNTPAMLSPPQSAIFYSERKRATRPSSKTKTSLRSFQTQKVYDLNENTEKLMSVIVSDKESNSGETESTVNDERNESDSSVVQRSASPPKIETDVSQVQLSKCSNSQGLQLYSTSSVIRSELTFRQRTTDSNWSGSSSSGQSMSSTTSKSRCHQSRSSRDLAWARRVVAKETSQTKSTSGTDYTSITTTPCKR